jgi:hypothetical protein
VRTPYYRREDVEVLAWNLLRRFEAQEGGPTELPVDVDRIGEEVLGLSWLYEPIPEPRGTTILAALHPEQRLVILNERYVNEFGRNEGLERFTKAHELGHWVCHARSGDRRQATGGRGGAPWANYLSFSLPDRTTVACRLSPVACEAQRAWQERHADWFAAALLMPPSLLRQAAASVDVTAWRGRYELRDRCGVSITALNARLRQLGFPEVRE